MECGWDSVRARPSRLSEAAVRLDSNVPQSVRWFLSGFGAQHRHLLSEPPEGGVELAVIVWSVCFDWRVGSLLGIPCPPCGQRNWNEFRLEEVSLTVPTHRGTFSEWFNHLTLRAERVLYWVTAAATSAFRTTLALALVTPADVALDARMPLTEVGICILATNGARPVGPQAPVETSTLP